MDAWKGNAQDQLQGQIASAKIPLTRMISPQLYWVMTGNDFSLDINNPKEPKLLCVGNNPDRQNIYSAALGLYNSRIVKLINKKKQLKCAVIIDELPDVYKRQAYCYQGSGSYPDSHPKEKRDCRLVRREKERTGLRAIERTARFE